LEGQTQVRVNQSLAIDPYIDSLRCEKRSSS
jgi:hypothetical protein